MALALRYAEPPTEVLQQLNVASIVGEYAVAKPENDFHCGTITLEKDETGGEFLMWKNAAGVSWRLSPDLPNAVLNTGPDDPYFEAGSRKFTLVLPRGSNGEFLPQIDAFRFNGTEYLRQQE